MLKLTEFEVFEEYLTTLFKNSKFQMDKNPNFIPFEVLRIFEILYSTSASKRKNCKKVSDFEFIHEKMTTEVASNFYKLLTYSFESRILIFFMIYEKYLSINKVHILECNLENIEVLINAGYSISQAYAVCYIAKTDAIKLIKELSEEIDSFSSDYSLKKNDLIIAIKTLFRGVINKGYTVPKEIQTAMEVFEVTLPLLETNDVVKMLRIIRASLVALDDFHFISPSTPLGGVETLISVC